MKTPRASARRPRSRSSSSSSRSGAFGFGKPQLARRRAPTSRRSRAAASTARCSASSLSGLNGAACRLHTTREELVLSFVPAAGTKRVRWDRPTIEAALKAGFRQAIEDTEHRGVAGYVVGHVLDVIVGAPLDFLLELTD